MKLTSEMIKKRAEELGIDVVGIANIERFANAPTLLSPVTYFPGAKSVIAVLMRIPRGSYRGIEEGTQWHNYTFYSYNKLNSFFRPRLTYELCRYIEDHGWEAVPHYPAVPEGQGLTSEPVAPGKVPPDVVLSVRMAAAAAGAGEIGYSKVLLTKKFGPRVRIGIILTDCELEPDPILDTGTICLHCGACVRDCPGDAVPDVKDESKRIYIDFGDKVIWYGDVQMGRCTLTHHGFNNVISPFLKKEFPNMAFDVRHSQMTEEEAYILCYTMAYSRWFRKPGNRVLEYYSYMLSHTGYFAICGARGCIRSCMDMLEKSGRIENIFHNPFFKKKRWLLPNEPQIVTGRINPYREAYLDENYPGIRKNEY